LQNNFSADFSTIFSLFCGRSIVGVDVVKIRPIMRSINEVSINNFVDQSGVNQSGVDQSGFDQSGVDQSGVDQWGVDE
jgi:hypothetical protein